LVAEAVALAKTCAVAVVFAGLPDSMESEGVDRKYMRMPDGYNRLIEAICAVQPNTVVVLHNGSPVEVPWADSAPAILEAYLGGQAVGEAVVNILYGDVNPSGHLAESFPFYLADNPSYLFFPGEGDQVLYSERMFIGYRYYASKEMTVRYPFGHGLSYTTFRFDGLILDKHDMSEDETVTASVTVTNTGVKTGRALVQLYVAPPKGEVIRPLRELKAFEKLELQPGESQTITLELGKRAFAFWNPARQDWCIENGAYTIQIGQNAHEIIQEAAVLITGKRPLRLAEFTASTPMKQFAQHPFGKQFVNDNLGYLVSGMAAAGFIPMQLLQAIGYQPGSPIALETIEEISQRAGAAAGGGSGLDALLNQPISIMLNFMPEKQKNDFSELLLKMNGK
jgi:beta-glucosidase